MASRPARDISEYPRPWFYRPEIYYGLIIFPPVWSILTLRSPWHKGEGFFGIFIGGLAWFFLIAAVVLSVRWVQEGGVLNLFVFVPGVLLTLLTQVQWQAHRAHHGPPPTSDEVPESRTSERSAGPEGWTWVNSPTDEEASESRTQAPGSGNAVADPAEMLPIRQTAERPGADAAGDAGPSAGRRIPRRSARISAARSITY